MRFTLFSLVAIAGINVPAAAQSTTAAPDSVTTGSIALVQSRPQGDFGRNTGAGYGIAGTLFLRVAGSNVLSMRLDVAGLVYGNETRRTPLSDEIGGRIQVRTSTTNYIVPASIGPQITWPTGTVRPYATAGVGGQAFFTESSVSGTAEHFTFASTTNQSDVTALWTAGGGVYLRLSEGRVPVMLDLAVQYIDGGRARYLGPGSITDLPGAELRITPFESRTQMMLVRHRREDRPMNGTTHSAHVHHHPRGVVTVSRPGVHHHAMQQTETEVYVELDARPTDWAIAKGTTLKGWSYNGQIPGPVIEAHVGDTLVVRLTNNLPEPTTIHWHGLRIPAVMDGTEVVQHPVAPGETFEYRFVLPDAGTFWFHPHTNETVQLERGLHGVLVVHERGAADLAVDGERVLVLDDVLLDGDADFASFDDATQRHDGRDGNVLLLNGRADTELTMAAGQVERWRIVNVANSRYMRLSFEGREFRLIATDGGLIERPVTMRELLLVPGDRVEILVGPFLAEDSFAIEALPYDRGAQGDGAGWVATVRVGATASSNIRVPATLRSIAPLALPDAAPTRHVRFSGRRNAAEEVEFLVNGETHHDDKPVRVGELQVWEIMNATRLDHPFHLHGFFFQVLSENGSPPAFRSWEDTYNVPAKGRVVIAWMPDDRPGNWMYHCHILEHHATGMMANFVVARPGQDISEVQGEAMGACHM